MQDVLFVALSVKQLRLNCSQICCRSWYGDYIFKDVNGVHHKMRVIVSQK